MTEKNLNDEVLAWWETDPLPDDALVTHVMLFPYRGDRVVLAWKDGAVEMPMSEVRDGEDAEAAIRRIAAEQAGIASLRTSYLGHWLCKATTRATTQAPGTVSYRPVYGVYVDELMDFPTGDGYERRIVLQRELVSLIRTHHTELKVELMEALDRFIVERTRQSAAP
jgi:hypothetical protein